ncbi:siphovirus Gp157 family protein [Acinetobacter radioresistens]|uniref:siphovirus Gp157 family protein n=1 Tax=Acinetobacter radioresistens TaxID=40216 RepID=UPI00125FFBBA|nr:siphovirus Gp157 family protein [Acinetobacter radioresistens]
MTTLYEFGTELAVKIENIQELLAEGADPNSNQVQELLMDMVGTEENWKEKAKNVAKYVHQLELESKMIAAESRRIADKAKKLDQTANYLSNLLLQQMLTFGVEEIKDPVLSVKVCQNPWSVIVKDESRIPGEFKKEKVVIEVDKRALLNSREIIECDGVEFIRTQRLTFK